MTLRQLLIHFENTEMKIAVNSLLTNNLPASLGNLKTIREVYSAPGFAITEGMKTVINWKIRQDNVLEVIVA